MAKENKEINSENMSFEAAMKRLDEVNEALGKDNVKLEEALKLYEEGVMLVRICSSKLEDAERKIKQLKLNSTGEITEEDFDSFSNK